MVAGEDGVLRHETGHRQPVDHADPESAGEGGQTIDQGLLQDQQLGIASGCGVGDGDTQRLQRAGLAEPRLDPAHRLEGADHQARADEEHQRQRHLDDGQGVAGDVAVAACTRVAAARAQRFSQADAAALEHRNRPEGEAGGNGEDQREEHRRAIDRDQIEARQPGRREAQHQLDRAGGQTETGGAAEDGQQQALGQHLAGQAAAPGADGRADGKLLGPPLGPDQH